MQLDADVLIDAGTGVGELELEELKRVDHIFLTHSHLDHVALLPLLIDTVGWMRRSPVTLHAPAATLAILREHVFNWKIWPDFTEIPSRAKPALRLQPIEIGQTIHLGSRRITVLSANHVVPAVGYHLDSGRESLVYTGDTTSNDAFWAEVNKIKNLRYLIIETAFPDRERDLATASKHLCPSLLAQELKKLHRLAQVFITHLKPGEADLTMREIAESAVCCQANRLEPGQIFEF
jgi:cAMP phosphodiesterase